MKKNNVRILRSKSELIAIAFFINKMKFSINETSKVLNIDLKVLKNYCNHQLKVYDCIKPNNYFKQKPHLTKYEKYKEELQPFIQYFISQYNNGISPETICFNAKNKFIYTLGRSTMEKMIKNNELPGIISREIKKNKV